MIRWRWVVRVVVGVAALLVLYVAVTFVQVWQATGRDDVRAADAIVVLGAAQYDGRPSPALQARLDRALELYEAGWADLVVTTGANQEGDRFTEGYTGLTYLLERGVPAEAVLTVTDGRDTYESLRATARVLAARGLDEVLLVSDPFHSLRLAHTAAEVGLHAGVTPTDGSSSLRSLVRETAAVALGRFASYRRLAAWR